MSVQLVSEEGTVYSIPEEIVILCPVFAGVLDPALGFVESKTRRIETGIEDEVLKIVLDFLRHKHSNSGVDLKSGLFNEFQFPKEQTQKLLDVADFLQL